MRVRLGQRVNSGLVVSYFFSSRRRHTRCSRDWTSDVCSSDLNWTRYGRKTLFGGCGIKRDRSEEHTSELQSRLHLVCRLLLEKKKKIKESRGRRSSSAGRATPAMPTQSS